jgi:hypothetical protein
MPAARLEPLSSLTSAELIQSQEGGGIIPEDPLENSAQTDLGKARNGGGESGLDPALATKFSQLPEDLTLTDEESVRYRLEFKAGLYMYRLCCGAGAARSRNFRPGPELEPGYEVSAPLPAPTAGQTKLP